MKIYHIIPSGQWEAVQQDGDGLYRGDTLDSEGFIHFSTREQVLWVANARFQAHTGLLLLEVDTDKLRHELRFEPPFEGASGSDADMKFPHLYGELNLNAVIQVYTFEPKADGTFDLPPGV
ncbi:MAG: DUF952 domain-containing protein [bacterium]|nr:DUF952 domain-containing protein [bacterium]